MHSKPIAGLALLVGLLIAGLACDSGIEAQAANEAYRSELIQAMNITPYYAPQGCRIATTFWVSQQAAREAHAVAVAAIRAAPVIDPELVSLAYTSVQQAVTADEAVRYACKEE